MLHLTNSDIFPLILSLLPLSQWRPSVCLYVRTMQIRAKVFRRQLSPKNVRAGTTRMQKLHLW